MEENKEEIFTEEDKKRLSHKRIFFFSLGLLVLMIALFAWAIIDRII